MKTTIPFLICLLLLAGKRFSWGADYFLNREDQDATILVDKYQDSLWPWGGNVAVGDFNGDGKKDVAIRCVYIGETGVKVIFGRSFPKVSLLSQVESFRIPLPSSMLGTQPIAMGDIIPDGKDELLVSDLSAGTIHVFTGSSNPNSTIGMDAASIRIVGTPNVTGKSFVVGDFNGDGIMDVAAGYQRSDSRKAIGIVFGKSGLPPVINLATSPDVVSVVLKSSSWDILSIMAGRFSRPGADDLVAWVTTPSNDQILVFGTTTWSTPWDLIISPPTAMASYSRNDIKFKGTVNLLTGDLTGDGVDDVAINVELSDFTPQTYNQQLLDGSQLLSLGQWDLNATAVPWIPDQTIYFSGNTNLAVLGMKSLDFDGDGKRDLVLLRDELLSLDLYLDADRPALSSTVAFFYGSPFLRTFWTNALNTILIPGDFNGDGMDDILIHSEIEHRSGPVGSPYSMFSVIYGHRPLRNPTVQVLPRPVASSRVDLSLSVGGDPVEMRLSGDISDPMKDQWIPFQTGYTVTLTSPGGTKDVRATFRNKFHRESETVTKSLQQDVTDMRTTLVTNRMIAGRSGWVDCHLTESAHVKAEIFSLGGDSVRILADTTLGPGIVPLEWDGAGPDGRRVAPGVYVFVIDINDKRETHRILLK